MRLIAIPDELPFDKYDKENANKDFMAGVNSMKEWIMNQPTVDAVPVVRCKDCKFSDVERKTVAEQCYTSEFIFCRNSNMCVDETLAMFPEDYCSYGERKMDLGEEN